MYTLTVNRGDEGGILFLTYELLKFIIERGASFFIAEGFFIWDMISFSYSKQTNINEKINANNFFNIPISDFSWDIN